MPLRHDGRVAVLTALYVAANEGANIAESMRSVKAYVDSFVVIDSIFVSNPAEGTHSLDDQREVCERVAAPLPLAYFQSGGKMTETAARNLALSYLQPGDWGFIIDGDECLYGEHLPIVSLRYAMEDDGLLLSVAVPVYTTAILHEGDAPSMSRDDHSFKPIISTSSFMVRFFRMVEGLHYELPSGHITPMLTTAEGEVLTPSLEFDYAFIINRHATQPFDVYQNDYVWEIGARQP